ncbi:phosphoribosylamine--glycine ligase [Candidatus Nitrosotenuis chungbukensis]|uniref:phosphoribosylamine--glycine ligase n=1 Tax=Candidatus Nitrosotenuis chungbukensis TaxID=1353246 RepID=UPI0005B2B295|nr:phosphoribosylamine--glycine ligase [Candidatus Nitrosotenuis chungbukensis]
MVDVLVVGSGGREHAIGWKLSKSTKVGQIFFAPGNGGTKNNVPIQVDELDKLADFAAKNNCFTVVGPEVPLAMGIVDKFNERNLPIFGPTKNAAQIESSKIWAKTFMKRNNIPTAAFDVFDDPASAKEYVKSKDYDVVIKADGLAAGKGVIVCNGKQEAFDAIDLILVKQSFGNAGKRIIVEEKIDGVEASYIALSDGNIAIPMATSQDHKRIFDDDKGPNTGGMGAYSPTGVIDDKLAEKIQKDIIDKTIESLKSEGITFKGFLYAGIMLKDGSPYVLEYNARMGDPECQPILVRMDSDLLEYLKASSDGTLAKLPAISWKKQSAVCIVLASKGYPESYQKNDEIAGLDSVDEKYAVVFHAGTKLENNKVLTSGGRVLGVTALGDSLQSAIENAYSAAGKISWKNKYCRMDIGKKGLLYL